LQDLVAHAKVRYGGFVVKVIALWKHHK
jgi:hypothetical protein